MSAQDPARVRRFWTPKEDEILISEAERLLVQEGVQNSWSLIATKLPGRTNKDCRKRWLKVCKDVNKGVWTADEDERLRRGIETYGQRWTEVAVVVGTRHADQCAKRWQHSLDPSLMHAPWTPDEDELLLTSVGVHGRKWKTITEQHFLGRSVTDVKNRHCALSRERKEVNNNEDKTAPTTAAAAAAAAVDPSSSPRTNTTQTCTTPCYDFDFDFSDLDAGSLRDLDPALLPPHQARGTASSLGAGSDRSRDTPASWGVDEGDEQQQQQQQQGRRSLTTLTLVDVRPDTLHRVLDILIKDNTKVSMSLDMGGQQHQTS